MTGDIKYTRNMFGLLPVSDIAVCRLRGFLRKYYNCFSRANVIMHATGAFLWPSLLSFCVVCQLFLCCLVNLSLL